MRTSPSFRIAAAPGFRSSRQPRRSPSGIALISVLIVLAMLMVLVLAVLAMSRVETRASGAYARITDARTLADLPVNLVMGQIRQATSGLGDAKTWTSQPGMIRVFNTTTGANGRSELEHAYRLYSSDTMVQGSTFDSSLEAAAYSTWATQKTLFTDLNEPVVTDTTSNPPRKTFPIMDVKVFDADNDGLADVVADQDGKIEGARLRTPPPNASVSHPLPMPVRWIYVCQDGRLTVPLSENGEGEASFDSSVVTAANPITGRIAFWTDDESCKVNVNTAGEGVPWDVPRTTSWQDQNWALYIPGQNEFQRFPGHPAMTCLSTVLRSFDPVFGRQPQQIAIPYNGGASVPMSGYTTTLPSGKASYLNPDYLKNIYNMLPRTNWGDDGQSTRGGTTMVTVDNGLPIKRERIFASVDEFFYASNRQQNGPLGTVDTQDIHRSRAFLTAHSRAPETTLMNRPRVCLWPLFDTSNPINANARTAKDKLLAFASTAAGQTAAYYRAQRWQSDTNPGSSQSPTQDFDLQHNQEIFHYLQSVTAKPIPGFGAATFAEKYGSIARNQILLQMFDLQRWGLNSWHAEKTNGVIDQGKSYAYVPPLSFMRATAGSIGESSAVPTRVTALPSEATPTAGLKAFGRWPTITEAAIIFIPTLVKTNTGTQGPGNVAFADTPTLFSSVTNQYPDSTAGTWTDRTLKMRAFLVLQPFTPVVGMPPYSANIRYRIEGLENWQVNSAPMFRPNISTTNVLRIDRSNSYGTYFENAHMTAFTGLMATVANRSYTNTGESGYPFVSEEIDVSTADGTFVFPGTLPNNASGTGGDGRLLTIKIYSGYGAAPAASETPLQTLQIRFPTVRLRTPRLFLNTSFGYNFDINLMNPNNRFNPPYNQFHYFKQILIRPGDVVRSMVVNTAPGSPSGGDFRLLTARPVVTEDNFTPHPNYFRDAQNTTGAGNPGGFLYDAQSLRLANFGHPGHLGFRNLNEECEVRGNPAAVHLPGQQFGAQHIWQIAGYDFHNAIGNNTITNIKKYGLLRDTLYWPDCQPVHAIKQDGAYNADARPGDWDNGVGRVEDGPYINKPDEGGYEGGGKADNYDYKNLDVSMKYFSRSGYSEDVGKSYSPNRQIASAVAFGSLPSGVYGPDATAASAGSTRPWQTLLFCPNPPSRSTAALTEPTAQDHFGFGAPRDHLLLDNFWMPIVEPYAISEPFSTAGKVNMNHQLLPFTYIQRATALHAALQSVRVRAMPAALAWTGATPKTSGGTSAGSGDNCFKHFANWLKYETTYDINVPETLKAFTRRFDTQNDVFRSASEICDIFLVPKKIADRTYSTDANNKPNTNPAYEDMTGWWNGNLDTQDDGMELTGDNSRESPYNQLYPRLTTRSNVFQVYYRVQSLKKARSSTAATWREGKDAITADYRGSAIIERYLDPNASSLPNFITSLNNPAAALDDYYRFRIIQRKQFAP